MTSVIYQSCDYCKLQLPDIRYINEIALRGGQHPDDQHHDSVQSVSAASVYGHVQPRSGKVTLFNLE